MTSYKVSFFSLKRIFDCALSGAALFLLAPAMLGLALAVRLDSSGPSFFKQRRIGLGGREFCILKFRTMAHFPDRLGARITTHGDPRVTRLGRVLRRWKLDELPQLWNVVRGDMSLVGPRPEVPEYVALYPEASRAIVFSVRPGITDLASIKYRSESEILAQSIDPERTYREVVLPDKLALAVEYARTASLRGDIAILLRTIAKVIK